VGDTLGAEFSVFPLNQSLNLIIGGASGTAVKPSPVGLLISRASRKSASQVLILAGCRRIQSIAKATVMAGSPLPRGARPTPRQWFTIQTMRDIRSALARSISAFERSRPRCVCCENASPPGPLPSLGLTGGKAHSCIS